MTQTSPAAQVDIRYTPPHQSGAQRFSLAAAYTFPAQGITAVFGHSGSGKTTLLRCIAGLTRPEGSVHVHDQVWQNATTFVPVHKRSLGYVFQESGLLEHLSVRHNLTYAYKRRVGDDNAAHAIEEMTDLLGLNNLLDQHPGQLSGGERQRVAIARAILPKPRLLLMDEPLASLDAARKADILPYLDRLRQEFSIPVIYVTHQVDEITRLADHVLVLEKGVITAAGSVFEVLAQSPAFLSLGDATGCTLAAKIVTRDDQWHLMEVRARGVKIWLRDTGDPLGTEIRLTILARDVSLARQAPSETTILNRLACQIKSMQPDADPAMLLVHLQLPDAGQQLLARITRKSAVHLGLESGQNVWAQLKSVAVVR